MKGSRRHQLKKKVRLGKEQCDLSIEVADHPTPEDLNRMFALYYQTYAKSRAKFEVLNRLWFTKAAEFDSLHFVMLREKQTGAVVAFASCLDAGTRPINKYVGLDYSKPKSWMLYFRLSDAVVG